MRWTQCCLAVLLTATLGGMAAGQEIVGQAGPWMSPEMRYQLFSGPACSAPPYSYGPACISCRRPCCENAWADYCEKKSRCRLCQRRLPCGSRCSCEQGNLVFSGQAGPWIETAPTAPEPVVSPAAPPFVLEPSAAPPQPTPASPPAPEAELPQLQLPAPADAPPAKPANPTSSLRRLPPVRSAG